MAGVNPQIEESWKRILKDEFESAYFSELKDFLKKEKQRGKTIYPPGKLIFHAFNLCPFEKVKVVILGQDPYHGPGQAHGLCFSVCPPVPPPPSLVNIYKELHRDVRIVIPHHGNLEGWVKQGVLLLNTSLTVEAHKAGSHAGIGWHLFTDAVIRSLSEKRQGLVFLLWGRPAQNKAALIDVGKHSLLKSAHPSPLSAHRGFLGCGHFSKTNQILQNQGESPIDWQL